MRPIFQELRKRTDEIWYETILHNKVTGRKMTESERSIFIGSCMRTSLEVKDRITKEFGKLTAREYAEILEIKVEETEDIVEGFWYMGLYHPSRNTISVNKSVIEIIEKYIMENEVEEIIPFENIMETVLYHEIFHAMEEQIEGIYTRSKMLKRSHLGLFTTYYGLDIASEIGAIHFSKIMSKIDLSPCIYEQILLLATDQSYKENLIKNLKENSEVNFLDNK